MNRPNPRLFIFLSFFTLLTALAPGARARREIGRLRLPWGARGGGAAGVRVPGSTTVQEASTAASRHRRVSVLATRGFRIAGSTGAVNGARGLPRRVEARSTVCRV